MSQGKNLQTFKTALINEGLLNCKLTPCCCCRQDFTTVRCKDIKSFDYCVLSNKETNDDVEEGFYEMNITRLITVSLFT